MSTFLLDFCFFVSSACMVVGCFCFIWVPCVVSCMEVGCALASRVAFMNRREDGVWRFYALYMMKGDGQK